MEAFGERLGEQGVQDVIMYLRTLRCPHAESQTLAQKLLDAGFSKVTVRDEGIGSWKAKGHAVETADTR
jgi:hypothetical protein